jgi:ABC-type glycerol-3-phosphate transport system substrate-binding protein
VIHLLQLASANPMHRHTFTQFKSARYLILLLLLLLAACNSQPEATPTPQPVPALLNTPAPVEQTVTAATPAPTPVAGRIVLWHSWAQAEGDALAALLNDLRTTYPDLQIDTLFVAPDELVATYTDAVQGGGGPDLVIAPNWWLTDMAAAATVLPLDDLLPPTLVEQYWPATVTSLRDNGRLYGLPISYQTVALFVNTALVGDAEIPTTTDALLTNARNNPAQGIGLYATLFHTYWGFPAYGAELLDDGGKVILDQSAGSAAYLDFLVTLNETPGSYVNQDYGMLLDRFKKGEFAYFVDGPWAVTDLSATLGDALRVTSLPAGPVGPAQPWLYTDALFLNPNSAPAQQALALLVAQELTGAPAGATLATVGGLLPAARAVDLTATPRLQGFTAQAATAVPMPLRAEMQEVWGYGGDMLLKVLAGVAPPPAVVAETTALINEANGK